MNVSVKMPDVTKADCYNPDKKDQKSIVTFTIENWQDGSAMARVNGIQLMEFIKRADENYFGRRKIVRMLREAADAIEGGMV